MNAVLNDLKVKMEKALSGFQGEMSKMRTGRATISMLDDVRVDSYGSQMPLNQVATLSAPESRLITLSPWDKTLIKEIEKAILKSGLGLQPSNDGKIIRIPIPTLTEERRHDLVKVAKKSAEDARVHVRNIRREGNEIFKSKEKDKEISEDDYHRAEADVQKLTDAYISKIDQAISQKEKEILAV